MRCNFEVSKDVDGQKQLLKDTERLYYDEKSASMQIAALVSPVAKPKKIDLRHSQTRQVFYKEQKQKQEEAAKKARMLRKQSKKRERIMQAQVSKQLEKIEMEQKKSEQAQKLAEEQRNIEKQARVQEMQQRAEIRRQNLLETSRTISVPIRRPLYDSIEKQFILERVEPEKQRRKIALQEMKEKSKVSFVELTEHQRNYKQLQKLDEQRRTKDIMRAKKAEVQERFISPISRTNRIRDYVIEEDLREKERQLEKDERKKTLRLRRDQYGKIIRELHKPREDPLKALEMKMLVQKQEIPVLPKVYPPDYKLNRLNKSEVKMTPAKPAPPKPAQTQRDPMKINYIPEMRQKRAQEAAQFLPISKSIDIREDQDHRSLLKAVRSETDKLEKAAMKREGEIMSGNILTEEAIDAVKDVDEAIVTAIKAKLKILDLVS